MFPHISIQCLTAKRLRSFKHTVVLYPVCIMAIWLPSVYLGVVAADQFPGLRPGETDGVILRLLTAHTEVWLAGVLGAGIMACVMASDSQILALCTMFTEDVFAHYGGKQRFGDRAQVWTGRLFVVAVTVVAYLVALELRDKVGIFELAIRFAFSGYAALAPVMLAAVFWRRSTRWGALLAVAWVAASLGAGLAIGEANGAMVVDMGGGTTDVAVLSGGRVVSARTLRCAGNAMDEAIVRYVRREHQLLIGEANAERIKIEAGTALTGANGRATEVHIRGRDLRTGLGKSVVLRPKDVAEALSEPIARRNPPDGSRPASTTTVNAAAVTAA